MVHDWSTTGVAKNVRITYHDNLSVRETNINTDSPVLGWISILIADRCTMMVCRLWSTNRLMCDDSLNQLRIVTQFHATQPCRANLNTKLTNHFRQYLQIEISLKPAHPTLKLFEIHPWWIRILSSERTRTPMAFTWYWGFRQLPGVCVGRLIINHQLKLYLVYFSSLRLNLNYGRMCVQAVQVLYVEKGTLWLMFILYQFNSTIHAVIIQSWYNTMFIILSIYARPAGIMLKGRILVLGVRDS